MAWSPACALFRNSPQWQGLLQEVPTVLRSLHHAWCMLVLIWPLLSCLLHPPLASRSSLVHTFKHAFKAPVRQLPSPQQASTSQATSTTHITLHLSQLLPAAGAEAAADYMEVDAPEPAGPWPPVGTHLGHLPSHLVSTVGLSQGNHVDGLQSCLSREQLPPPDAAAHSLVLCSLLSCLLWLAACHHC